MYDFLCFDMSLLFVTLPCGGYLISILLIVSFFILNGFCIDCFSVYLKESSMEFHQILQTHSYVHGKYY